MVSPNSRRAFLLGRRTPPTTFGAFCARLSRTCSGKVRWHEDPARHQAWLEPAREADLLHAHALCLEYGVQIALAGDDVQAVVARPSLTVGAGAAWAQLVPVGSSGTLWRADAGCNMACVQGLGIQGVHNAAPGWNVAQWLASTASACWPVGQGIQSGIERVQVMLADGTIEVLGPFGARAVTPLRSLTVQKMVPRLFELANSPEAILCAQDPHWPARFRLDALFPAAGIDINLAWLMAGHGGALGWVQAVWFRGAKQASQVRSWPSQASVAQQDSAVLPGPVRLADWQTQRTGIMNAAQQLDLQLKKTFDPGGVFPSVPPPKGLESAS